MAECARGGYDSRVSPTGFALASESLAACYIHGHFTQQRWTFGDSPTESLDEGMVSFGAFGARSSLGLLRQRRRRHEPETNEERQGLHRDPDIALKPLRLPDQPVEPPRQGRFLPLGCVG